MPVRWQARARFERVKGVYRLRLDCDTTLPASVFVRGLDRLPSRAREAFCSMLELVCAELPAWRRAEPANERWRLLALLLPSVLPAVDATRCDVCFGLTAISHLQEKVERPVASEEALELYPVHSVGCELRYSVWQKCDEARRLVKSGQKC